MSKIKVKIKPCPFCGSQADTKLEFPDMYVECKSCGSRGQTFTSHRENAEGILGDWRKAVIGAWNTRPLVNLG